MSNEQMPSWEEWNNQLTDAQRQYSLYKILESLNRRFESRENMCDSRELVCLAKFERLTKRKWWDRGAALVGGAISGAAGALGIKWGS